MSCLEVVVPGRTSYPFLGGPEERRVAYERALENALVFAEYMCAYLGGECTEVDRKPIKAEMTKYEVIQYDTGASISIEIQFTFRCRRKRGCLTLLAPIVLLFRSDRRPPPVEPGSAESDPVAREDKNESEDDPG